nr:unnamed protein product [Callosobruchus chinensis]
MLYSKRVLPYRRVSRCV